MADALYNMGSIYVDQTMTKAARTHLSKAHEILVMKRDQGIITPTHPILIACKYNLGRLEIAKTNFDKALLLAEQIITHVSKYKWAYLIKAQALEGLERFDEAEEVYRVVIADDYADARIGLLKLLNHMQKCALQKKQELMLTKLRIEEETDKVDKLHAAVSAG